MAPPMLNDNYIRNEEQSKNNVVHLWSLSFIWLDLPHQVKTQYLYFRCHANYFLYLERVLCIVLIRNHRGITEVGCQGEHSLIIFLVRLIPSGHNFLSLFLSFMLFITSFLLFFPSSFLFPFLPSIHYLLSLLSFPFLFSFSLPLVFVGSIFRRGTVPPAITPLQNRFVKIQCPWHSA